jgi:hypothetical protein
MIRVDPTHKQLHQEERKGELQKYIKSILTLQSYLKKF